MIISYVGINELCSKFVDLHLNELPEAQLWYQSAPIHIATLSPTLVVLAYCLFQL